MSMFETAGVGSSCIYLCLDAMLLPRGVLKDNGGESWTSLILSGGCFTTVDLFRKASRSMREIRGRKED